jgi:hypothetical protein
MKQAASERSLSCWFLAYSLIPRMDATWQVSFNVVHGVIFQKVELFCSLSVNPGTKTAWVKGMKCFK